MKVKNKLYNYKKIIKKKIEKKEEESKPTRYRIFKRIKVYLESNNILLSDLMNNNPFQSKPYELRLGEKFIESVKFGNYEFVKEALSNNKNYLFVYDYFEQTAFHWAAKLGDLKMLKILISKGKNLNMKDKKGRTPLYFAAYNNNFDCVKILCDNGGNIFMPDNQGKKPIDVTNNLKIKVFLNDLMALPYYNPYIKKEISNLIKKRDAIIKKRVTEEKFLKMEKEDNKKIEKIFKDD